MERSTADSAKKEEDETRNELRDEALTVPRNELREEALSKEPCKNGLTKLSQKSIAEKLKTLPKLTMDGYELDLEITLDDKFEEKARKELRETPEVVAEALVAIKELIKEDRGLVAPDYDEFYVRFLRPCKWYPKSAFHLIQRFFRFRANYPNVARNLTPAGLKKLFSSDVLIPLPKRCINGCRILVVYSGYKWKPKEVSLEDILKGVMIIMEGALAEPKTQITGVQVIIDMEGLSLSQVTYFTPRFAAMVTEWVQRCLPCRLKNIHVINQPFIFNMVFAIFKPFLSEKLRKRIHFHGANRQNLLASIGAESLPKKYGGELKLSEKPIGEKLWKYFCYFQEEFEEALKYGYVIKE